MKTLRELGIEPTDDLVDYMEYESNTPREAALRLTQWGAVANEILYECEHDYFDWFKEIIEHYGGKIVFEGDSEEGVKDALRTLLHLIDSAGGPEQLSKAVVLGEISWMVEMSGAIEYALRLLDGGDSDDRTT